MPAMTDPTDALVSFQQALDDGELQLSPGRIDRGLAVMADGMHGQMRMSYARIERGTVIALAVFVVTDPIDDLPSFQLGIAVPEAHRRRGIAKATIEAGISEMKHGFARTGMSAFFVEAVVGLDNVASQHVAMATLSHEPKAITDEVSGLPALYYLRKVG